MNASHGLRRQRLALASALLHERAVEVFAVERGEVGNP